MTTNNTTTRRSTIQVDSEQVVDRLRRSGNYTGSLDQTTRRPQGTGRMEYDSSSKQQVSQENEDNSASSSSTVVVRYEGQWFNGDWSGYGKLTCTEHCYEGNFLDNQKHGLGVLTYLADGRVYDGSFQFDKMGKGKMTYQDGSAYWGYWSEDELPHGRGKLTKPDGTIYDGEFERGLIHGHGRMTFPDGRWYLGEFTDGTPCGLGLEVGSDGSLRHEGTFYNGTPIQCSSFKYQRSSSESQLLYRTKSVGNNRALVGPIPRELSTKSLFGCNRSRRI